MSHQPSVATIGYEKSTLPDFIAALKRAKVSIVIDVREVPLSNNEGFSKNHLARALREKDIGYVHLQGLGNPKAGREANKHGTEDWRQIYTSHLQSKIARDDLMTAVDIAKKQHACFLCYERNPMNCHRTILVKDLVAITKQDIEHLYIDKPTDQMSFYEVEDDEGDGEV